MNKNCNFILIGNGLDIQVSGDDYLNKWILVRLLAKAKMGKYDALFMSKQDSIPIITGDEIVELFQNMLEYSNKARNNEFSDLVNRYGDCDLNNALDDFKNNHKHEIKSIEEIGMEDWLLIFLIFLIEQGDILDQYESIKQGLERMVFDAIYCEGNIQKLHSKMNKSSKEFFSQFDKIFTLNYDNTIEKLTKHTVYHLHGAFDTKAHSENHKNALGYLRLQNRDNIYFPIKLKHCNCSAILDFSGERKYKFATNMTNAFFEFEKLKQEIKNNSIKLENVLEKLPIEQREITRIGVEKDLQLGQNYFFHDFEKLHGTLTIIGIAPQNDSHIFSCINKSDIDHVIFYHYFNGKSKEKDKAEIKSISLPINKPYIVKDVEELWTEIGVCKPTNPSCFISEQQLKILSELCSKNPINMDDILWQLNSVPSVTRKIIFEMLQYEISKPEYHSAPNNEKELLLCFEKFGKTIQVSALSPQALYAIYFSEINSNSKNHPRKRVKKKRKH